MSKRKIDGDVLVNRLNVGLANHKRLLASWAGLQTDAEPKNGGLDEEREEEDFKDEALGHEQLGVGGKVPKDIQDGSFTRRTLTTNDKLLQQLMGKKAAKAHLAAKKTPGGIGNTQKGGKPTSVSKPEESEDEGEGRAAAFKSKRRKTTQKVPVVETEEPLHDQAETMETDVPIRPAETEVQPEDTTSDTARKQAPDEEDIDAGSQVSQSQPHKPKKASYLDELLAERSKRKKKKKQKNKDKANP